MRRQIFDEQGLAKGKWRYFLSIVLGCYSLVILLVCFIPQPQLFETIQTPNVMSVGRFRLLLVPLNSLWSLSKLTSGTSILWVVGQNIMNIFLLYPLVFLSHCLWKKWQSPQKSLWLGFRLSLTIELTQLLLDFLVNANRVFELDDLWTNTLGALLAFYTYQWLRRKLLIT
ncbi:VanZ family protein [Streptococcus castoreus]|uniref:VanZ family protein n=1 Tax=Streptococcus castoreus TaxID=254786 RepID=UPI00041B015F|nr:VanZ family protein [Streptococcus castoreus]